MGVALDDAATFGAGDGGWLRLHAARTMPIVVVAAPTHRALVVSTIAARTLRALNAVARRDC
ncbi:MAG: hypothetical protein ACHREM_19500 [Polyangiales bacterium]